METEVISYEQERFFRLTGYLKLNEILSQERADVFCDLIRDDLRHAIFPLRRDHQGRISRLAQIYQRYPDVQKFLSSGQMLEAVRGILGPNVEIVLNRHNHATQNLSGSNDTRLHRDVLQWSRNLLTAIIYLEDATVDNGCTYVVPTTQLLPFVGKPNNGGTWMNENMIYKDLLAQALPVPAKKGDVLLLDSTTFHAVGKNTGACSRISMAVAYRSVDELEATHPHQCVLICGERLYKGNEINDIKE